MLAITYEGIDGLKAGLHRLVHGLPGDNAWSLQFDSGTLVGHNGASSIDGVTERINDSAEHALTDGHIDDGSGSLDDIAFLDFSVQSQKCG